MRLGRRKALGFAAATALAAGVAVLRTQAGYVLPANAPAARLALSLAEYCIVHALAERICAADGPAAAPSEVGVAAFVDGFAAAMDARLLRDLKRLLSFVEHAAPLALGRRARFTELPAASQDAVLRALDTHPIELLRSGFQGFKGLIFMGYYRDPRTWSLLRYEGPWVRRPAGGFAGAELAPSAAP